MPTSFSAHKYSDVVFRFAVELACAARVFTTRQLARHPRLSDYTNPQRRAREIIAPYRDRFEVLPWLPFNDYLWRLTESEKKRLGVRFRSVSPSQHSDHWLAIGDCYIELVFNGLRPSKWYTEGKKIGRYDVFAVIEGKPFLFEVQLSDLEEFKWRQKWHQRSAWIRETKWKDPEWAKEFCTTKPTSVLVTSHKMQLKEGITVPKSVLVADTIRDLPRVIRKSLRPPR